MPVSSDFTSTGSTGAGYPSRYAGATASGSPTFGAFAIGDFVIDRTGVIWVCTAAGIPGTWVNAGTGTGGLALPLAGGAMSGAIAMGNNKITGLANGTNDTDAANLSQVPNPVYNGIVAWSWDIAGCGGTGGHLVVAGTLYLTAFVLASPQVLTNILTVNTSPAVTPTSGQSQVGVYNFAGSLLASATTTVTATQMVNTGNITYPLSAPYTATAGNYWVGAVFQATTTPTMLIAQMSNTTDINIGLSASTYRAAKNGTGITTALPSSVTAASNQLPDQNYWFGVS